jgi:hypothetical protein
MRQQRDRWEAAATNGENGRRAVNPALSEETHDLVALALRIKVLP